MMLSIRSLTADGRMLAAQLLQSLRSDDGNPETLMRLKELDDDANSEALDLRILPADEADWESRWHVAHWLSRTIAPHDGRMNAGAWSWLALHYLDRLCPKKNGRLQVGADERYLYRERDFRKSHRHLLRGPYALLRTHKDDPTRVRAHLAGLPHTPGEVYEQLTTLLFLVTSPAANALATSMYFDHETERLKSGSGGSGPGSPRRYSRILRQLDLTYDFQEITEAGLRKLLPSEFDRFMSPKRVP